MSQHPVPESYVRLCLRVGEHLEDFVDAYIGPRALREEVRAEGRQDPRSLRDDALALIEAVPNEDLEEDRVRWLLAQLRGIECVAARLCGDDVSWSDEVERCFGIRPRHVEEGQFEESHKRLDEVLPGSGDLSFRYNGWIESNHVPRETLPDAIEVINAEVRGRAAAIAQLPEAESVHYKFVTDEPWQAFNWYKGDLNSVVEVNLDLPFSIVDLVDLVAHEAYPGHHTERVCKERLLYRERGRFETCVMVLSAPEAVVSEGIATTALEVALGDEGLQPVLDLVRGLGYDVDADVAEAVRQEEWQLFEAATNVARMLHENGMSREDAEAYLHHWALDSPERAAKTVDFLTVPGSRAYATAYTDGRRLCRTFMDRHEDGFKRLLTEQLTVSSLLDPES